MTFYKKTLAAHSTSRDNFSTPNLDVKYSCILGQNYYVNYAGLIAIHQGIGDLTKDAPSGLLKIFSMPTPNSE